MDPVIGTYVAFKTKLMEITRPCKKTYFTVEDRAFMLHENDFLHWYHNVELHQCRFYNQPIFYETDNFVKRIIQYNLKEVEEQQNNTAS